jgi:hypothetical protein
MRIFSRCHLTCRGSAEFTALCLMHGFDSSAAYDAVILVSAFGVSQSYGCPQNSVSFTACESPLYITYATRIICQISCDTWYNDHSIGGHVGTQFHILPAS